MRSVSRQHAIEALRDFRIAAAMIAKLHSAFGQRCTESIYDGRVEQCELTEAELEDYRVARDHLVKSISLNPHFPDSHWMLANAYSEIDNDTEMLLKYYDSCLELDPWYDDVIVARMGVLMEMGDLPSAEQDLLLLEELVSSHASAMRMHFDQASNAG